jgi:hypothetical protein
MEQLRFSFDVQPHADLNQLSFYAAKFGTPVVGSAVQFRIKFISDTTGQAMPYQYATAIVA